MSEIFISYRRDDSQGFAGRLEDDLSEHFGDERVFRDREIPVGTDFATHLERTLARAEVVLVVIGPQWLAARGGDGARRLDDPRDWVRREIELAIGQGAQVVPVLVGGASMPAAAALPAGLRALAARQAFVLSDRRWRAEVRELAGELAKVSPRLADAAQASVAKAGRIRQDGARRGSNAPAARSLALRVGAWLMSRLGTLLALCIVLAVVYLLIRADGDPRANRILDNLVAMLSGAARRLLN